MAQRLFLALQLPWSKTRTTKAAEIRLDSLDSQEASDIAESVPFQLEQQQPNNQFQLRLIYDILELVIAQVFFTDWNDLFSLCRVCKQLYFACIPWIYRRITIDFSSRVSLSLLQRLARQSTGCFRFVRDVTLKGYHATENGSQEWRLLNKCLYSFTNLSQLACSDGTNLPEYVLNTLHHFHPRANFQLRTSWTSIVDVRNPSRNFFQLGALEQLTKFQFSASSNAVLYRTFKQDLVQLLERAPNLVHLHIYQGPIEEYARKVYPEMISEFQACRLPRLLSLQIATKSVIFTRAELDLWGLQGGWSELCSLELYHAHYLIPFLSRVQNLKYLGIVILQGYGELEKHLRLHTDTPFGMVEVLTYNHCVYHNDPMNPPIMPWAIIKTISATLKHFICWHQPVEVFHPGYATPSVKDVRRLSRECPQLIHLKLDIRVCRQVWPREILEEFAAFHNLNELSLYVHQPMEPPPLSKCAPKLSYRDARRAFKLIRDARVGSVSDPKLRINVTEICTFTGLNVDDNHEWSFIEESTEPLRGLQVKIVPKKESSTQAFRRDIWKWSLDSLQYYEELFREQISWFSDQPKLGEGALGDYWVIRQELERRERIAGLEERYGDASCTLYEYWSRGKDMNT